MPARLNRHRERDTESDPSHSGLLRHIFNVQCWLQLFSIVALKDGTASRYTGDGIKSDDLGSVEFLGETSSVEGKLRALPDTRGGLGTEEEALRGASFLPPLIIESLAEFSCASARS